MPHQRLRFALPQIQKLSSFWPIVGVLGLRQVGKTTLLRRLAKVPNGVTLDDEGTLSDARNSAKVFLAKLDLPVVIDEVQKAPGIFDALKVQVDQERIPGQYYLTGSTSFSAKLGIRESLTGRIGLMHLFPLTLGEAAGQPMRPHFKSPFHLQGTRFTIENFAKQMVKGGLPVPMFARDAGARDLYWKSWIETTIYRDTAKLFGTSYDPDLAMVILRRFGALLSEGELPTLRHFELPSRKLRSYLAAMEGVFLLRRLICHERGIGKDVWILGDSGLAHYLMSNQPGAGATLSLARHTLLNEISAHEEYHGRSLPLVYYKSATGTPVDLIWNGIPLKITASATALGWEKRALEGAMKALGAKRGLLVAPRERPQLETTGVSVIPWTFWS